MNACTRPPEGWYCTLPEGHEGPCPTWPDGYRSIDALLKHWHISDDVMECRHCRYRQQITWASHLSQHRDGCPNPIHEPWAALARAMRPKDVQEHLDALAKMLDARKHYVQNQVTVDRDALATVLLWFSLNYRP